jgi:AraC-like DNA-binding protein
MVMEIFVAAIIVMMSLSVATFQVVRNFKYRELAERKHRLTAALLYIESILVICDLCSGGDGLGMRLVVDVMLVIIPLSVLSSSLWVVSRSMPVVYCAGAGMLLLAMYHILCAFGLSSLPPQEFIVVIAAVLSVAYVTVFLLGVWFRVREVRAVIQAGTVWAGISLASETVYVAIVLTEITILMTCGMWSEIIHCAVVLLLGGAMAGYGLRIACDSLFIIMKRHERTIVESMKISPVEVSGMGPDDIYKDIYERVLEYFERDKPFLNGDLTINDVVAVVFTNKLYISRAISQHTGRNFCQFVNYHRVMYSVECFRRNPELKVTELWSMCGFNTIVSYNMAFKLFLGENPSDWCRKEKIRLFRRPK